MPLIPRRLPIYAPPSEAELAAIGKKCRAIVTRRALLSASVSALPIPGLDVLTDVGLLVRAINTINHEFGLTPEQLAQLQPEKRVIAFRAIVGAGSMLVGKLVTHRLAIQLLKHAGFKVASRQASKIIPIAGQVVAAAIGFAAFRTIANQHIEACQQVAAAILRAEPVAT
jgi:uncharacterized protein (DUF697 family)